MCVQTVCSVLQLATCVTLFKYLSSTEVLCKNNKQHISLFGPDGLSVLEGIILETSVCYVRACHMCYYHGNVL
jgi:hypothetical protein